MTHITKGYEKPDRHDAGGYEITETICDQCGRSDAEGLTMKGDGYDGPMLEDRHICNECLEDRTLEAKGKFIGSYGIYEHGDPFDHKLLNRMLEKVLVSCSRIDAGYKSDPTGRFSDGTCMTKVARKAALLEVLQEEMLRIMEDFEV